MLFTTLFGRNSEVASRSEAGAQRRAGFRGTLTSLQRCEAAKRRACTINRGERQHSRHRRVTTITDEVAAVADSWVSAGTHLVAVAKSLVKGGDSRLEMLSTVIDKGAELEDHSAIVHAMGTAARLHGEGVAAAKGLFMHGIRELAKRNDANWARAVWFNRDFKTLVASMDAGERAEVLQSLGSLRKLDYQSEEVLAAVC